MESVLRSWIEAEPNLALSELSERLATQGVLTKPGGLWHQLNKWNLMFKKNLHASEQEREDVEQRRLAWVESLPAMDVEKLVFINETWTLTSMSGRCGRATKGKRCIALAPHGLWKTTTFVGALRRRKLTAPMVIDGPMEGEIFLAYVRQFLCPTLKPGDVVILDNLSSQKVSGVEEVIHATGAHLLLTEQQKSALSGRAPSANAVPCTSSRVVPLLCHQSKLSASLRNLRLFLRNTI